MKLLKAMATVAGLTGLSRIAGFIRDIMTASLLGAGPMADAFFVALKLPNFFRRITAEGAFSVSFVPIYSGELEREGRESADRFANKTFSLMLAGLSVFTLLAIIFMPIVIDLIAPGFDDGSNRYEMAVSFSRITFPYLLLMSLTSLLGGVLNAHDRFAPFAIAPCLFNVGMIVALLMADSFPSPGYALSWGVAAAGVMQLILLWYAARRIINFRVKIVRPQFTPRIKRLFKLMGPGVIGASVVQINLFADMIIGSFLPAGSISYLYYADRLNQLPLSTVGIAVGTALLPMLTRAVAGGRIEEARDLFNRALEVTLFLGLPAALALLMLAHPIVKILFEHGEFTAEATRATAFVLQGYVIGLPAYIGVKVFSTAFWSKEDTLTPVKISVFVTLGNIALALLLIKPLGVGGIALATGLIGWVHIVLLAIALRGNPVAVLDERFKRVMPRMVASALIMAAALYGLNLMVNGWINQGTVLKIAALMVLVGGGGIVYFTATFATGAMKLSELKKYLTRRSEGTK